MKIKILLYWLVFVFPVQASIKLIDDKGTEFEFSRPMKRIISLAPHATELLFASGATDQIVGTVSYSDYPEAAKKIPLIGGYNKVDIELIVLKKPDLIIAWAGGNSAEQLDKIRSLGFKVFISEPKKFVDIAKNIRRMGQLLGTEKIAEQVALHFLTELEALKHEYPEKEKVRVFYQVWNDPLMTISDDHLVGQVIKFCSGENVFGDMSVISPRISIEAVIEKNPDVIIAGMTRDRTEWLKEWGKWKILKAVMNKHVYPIEADLVVRQTPRILQGTRKMCEYLDRVRVNARELRD
ncbi:Vitamin B12 ABC transporter, substrate-binding protein BtuF [hydrothermal vent metagenome]|uniref:Vitamin B12 ABC transporter, substrate-binding protein BtuF n=1 Tax=hydrothermal vent metagenome TaxID=652676 RepID=A0A3B0WWE6_9ZZZZ